MRSQALLFFLFYCLVSTGQTLSVNQPQLTFGNVSENTPDSLQLSISNNMGKDVTVTGIRFYNTYSSPAFSCSDYSFVIPDGGSRSVWVKFHPHHNILHNSEMIILNDGLRGHVSVDLTGQGIYSIPYYSLTQNLSEENLKTALKVITGNGYVSAGYTPARDEMYMVIDNKKVNGQGAGQNTIECVYTGREAIGYIDRQDCQSNFSFNTEHTFPQSFFSGNEPMLSDLHHLFPTDDGANSERANIPFGNVNNPSWTSGGSKSDGNMFEPRDEHKGNVARAMLYFVLRYQNYNNFLNSQENILRSWHFNFLPTSADKNRNDDIFNLQNNRNPFVDYPQLAERINSFSSASSAPLLKNIDLPEDTIILGTVNTGMPVDYHYIVVNNGNADVSLSNFSLSHPGILSFNPPANDTTIQPGESLSIIIRCMTSTPDSLRGAFTFNSDATGAATTTVPIFVNDPEFTAVNEIENSIMVYPNPANEKIFIPFETHCTLTDFAGKVILSEKISAGELDVSRIQTGMYILKFFPQNRIVKILVE